jgi:hypothetical protein
VTAVGTRPRQQWPRGMLIGLAATLKLTPAVFVLYFLRRAAAVSDLSWPAATALGFLVPEHRPECGGERSYPATAS